MIFHSFSLVLMGKTEVDVLRETEGISTVLLETTLKKKYPKEAKYLRKKIIDSTERQKAIAMANKKRNPLT